MYEVDNRYPEVAEAYEKVRGVKRHGGVNLGSAPLVGAYSETAPLGASSGSAGAYVFTRAARINNLKRSFWTSAVAVITVICLLLVSPREDPQPVEPEVLREPVIRIVSAVLDETQDNELRYSYRVELNDAERGEVTVRARAVEGELLAEAGPFSHSRSETSPTLTLLLTQAEDLSRVVLEVVCVYPWEEETRETGDQTVVILRTGPPEPVTEPVTEPTTEPATEPVTEPPTEPTTEPATEPPTEPTTEATEPTETAAPFTAPTLRIASAALNGTAVTPLTYSYNVTLNSAERLRVTAAVTDQNGRTLGSGGPWDHEASGTSPARSAALTWSTRPTAVTLTLTGTYTEQGEVKTVTASQTLNAPAEPFVAPTLTISYAALNGTDVTPLTYRCRIALNSADSLRVTAVVTDQNGRALGSGGPFTHSSSGTSPTRSMALTWTTRPSSVTLTLTGVYTERGATKTVTASQTLTVPEEPFTAPTLTIVSASLNGTDVSPLTYSYRVALNSADSLRVTAAVTDQNGRTLGSGGPYTHTASEASPSRSAALTWTARPSSVTLTLTGTYTEKGTTKTITARQTLSVAEPPFVSPTLTITDAALNGTDVTPLTYSYRVVLNSAESLRVTAAVTDQSGRSLGSGGPYTHTASGTSPDRTAALAWSARPSSVTLTLTGTYTENGTTKTLTASQTLTVPEEPFIAPTLRVVSAALNGTDVTPLTYSCNVTLNSAASLRVTAKITSETNANLGSGGPWDHTTSGTSPVRSIDLAWTTRPESVTLTLTGTYTEKGVEKTVTASETLTVPEEPFVAPTLSIDTAALNGTDVTPLSCGYTVTLNSAASMRVTAAVVSDGGQTLGSGGPWDHTTSGTSPVRSIDLAWATRPESVTLTLTGTYTEKGVEKTVTASETLTVPEEPFVAPTLSIDTAALNGTDVTPLSCGYTVTLNSAESMRVTAAVVSDGGQTLGSGGPWSHTASGSSPTRSIDLAWTTRPESVTLTLTGTYTEKGVEKTVTASETLTVPEEPFVAPTLRIESGRVLLWQYMFLYNYSVDLKSASELTVEARFTYEDDDGYGTVVTYEVATDGPYTHDSALTTELILVEAEEFPDELPVTLTLTGTYTDRDGTEQTITVTKELDYCMPPDIWVYYAERDGTDPDLIRWEGELTLNDADSIELYVTIGTEDADYASNGPFPYNADGTVSGTIRADGHTYEELLLTVTGKYQLEGVSLETEGYQFVNPQAFTAPTITIDDAALNGTDVTPLSCSYTVALNSAQSLNVTAAVTADGMTLGSGGPWDHTASGASPTRSIDLAWTTRPETLTLTLTGSYEDQNGAAQTVTAARTLEVPEAPFVAPTLAFSGPCRVFTWEAMAYYAYTVDLNDATEMTVEAQFFCPDEYGGYDHTDGPYTHSASGTTDRITVPLEFEANLAETTLTLIGRYKDNHGVEQEIRVARELDVFNCPHFWILSAERDSTNPELIVYDIQIELGSLDALTVNFSLDGGGVNFAADTDTFTTDGIINGRTLLAAGSTWTDLVLTASWSYELDGDTWEDYYPENIPGLTFTPPTLRIDSAKGIPAAGKAVYSYTADLNSAAGMIVNAEFYYEKDLGDSTVQVVELGSDGPYIHSASGTGDSIPVDITGYEADVTAKLKLTGTYMDADGVEQELQATRELEVLTAPTVTITSAARNPANPNQLIYSAEIRLNSADALELSVDASAGGVTVAADGPFTFTADADLNDQTLMALDTAAQDLILTLTGSYELAGLSLETDDTAEIAHTTSFVAPTLTIESARVFPLEEKILYSYTVDLKDAEALDVDALFTYDDGGPDAVEFAADGPYHHPLSGTTGKLEVSAAAYPGELPVELTLTGYYLDGNGEQQKIEKKCAVPEFYEPEVSITSAERDSDNPDRIVYSAMIWLSSADELEVRAKVEAAGATVASGGPFTFNMDDEINDETILAEGHTAEDLVLTLTGSYVLDGETFEISDTADIPGITPFVAPELTIVSAQVLPEDYSAFYSYSVDLKDAAKLDVEASFTYADGGVTTEIGSDGPYSHTANGPSPEHKVWLDEYPTTLPVTLTLTGTYEDNHGVEQTLEVKTTLTVFIEPQIIITSAARDSENPDKIVYSAQIKPNSADQLDVMVEAEATDVPIVSDGPFSFTSEGYLTDQTIVANGSSAHYLTLTLTGTYTLGGELMQVIETADLDPFLPPFEAPTLFILSADVEPFDEWEDATLDYSYHLDVGTAENVRVKASVAAGSGGSASGYVPEVDFPASSDYSDSIPLYLDEGEASVVLTLLCTYEDYDGVEGSFTVNWPIVLSMKPEEFDVYCEFYSENDVDLLLWLSADFLPQEGDPHKAAYDFELADVQMKWYNDANENFQTVDLTAAASAVLTGGYEPEYVFYHYLSELTVPIPEIAASVSFTLTLRDKTTGRTYSKATEIMALN